MEHYSESAKHIMGWLDSCCLERLNWTWFLFSTKMFLFNTYIHFFFHPLSFYFFFFFTFTADLLAAALSSLVVVSRRRREVRQRGGSAHRLPAAQPRDALPLVRQLPLDDADLLPQGLGSAGLADAVLPAADLVQSHLEAVQLLLQREPTAVLGEQQVCEKGKPGGGGGHFYEVEGSAGQ